MIICKYTKVDAAAYIPHLDLLRTVGMAIRRTGLDIAFSEGFNPHARLFFSQPMPLGTQSIAEYFCADSAESAQNFMNKLNSSLPNGITILNAANLQQNPNPASLAVKADYEVKLSSPLDGVDFSQCSTQKPLVISYEQKGKRVEKDVSDMIFSVKNTSDTIFLTLACGNINLRADRLVAHLLENLSKSQHFTVKKTAVYDKNSINLDDLFFAKS